MLLLRYRAKWVVYSVKSNNPQGLVLSTAAFLINCFVKPMGVISGQKWVSRKDRRAHTNKSTLAYTNIHSHTHTLAHTHTRTHTLAHTHTHKHSQTGTRKRTHASANARHVAVRSSFSGFKVDKFHPPNLKEISPWYSANGNRGQS